MKKVRLFSDGSCLDNPGTGGWAYIIDFNGNEKQDFGSMSNTTNNQMELLAVINGLKALKEPCHVELCTDSQYVQKGLNEWLNNWIKKDFKNVKNVDLWKELHELSKTHKIDAVWVKGHSGHPQNEKCDTLARSAAQNHDNIKTTSDPKLIKLQKILNYSFKDEKLLIEALTHKSVKAYYNNERLEFLGDAVLDLIVGEYLYKKNNGQNNEGNLSKLRAALVNEESFANIAKLINLGEFLYLSVSEENNGGRNKPSLISNALEAVMGAIYLENGLKEVEKIFINLLEQKYKNFDLQSLVKDYKTTLQELTQAYFGQIPEYKLISSTGPDHKKEFEMAVFLNGKELAKSRGNNKKEAEQKAAKIAIEVLNKNK